MKSFFNIRLLLFLSGILLLTSRLFGQDILYSYDNNGNRTERTLSSARTSEMTFPLNEKELKKLNSNEALVQKEVTPEEKSIRIYPNPTTGIIKIEFDNYYENTRGRYRLFNLAGTVIREGELETPYSEFNLGNAPNGMYILKVQLNDIILDYKIIKKF